MSRRTVLYSSLALASSLVGKNIRFTILAGFPNCALSISICVLLFKRMKIRSRFSMTEDSPASASFSVQIRFHVCCSVSCSETVPTRRSIVTMTFSSPSRPLTVTLRIDSKHTARLPSKTGLGAGNLKFPPAQRRRLNGSPGVCRVSVQSGSNCDKVTCGGK